MRDTEIDKLHEKAKEFENFMRASNQRDSLASEPKDSSSNNSRTKTDNSAESLSQETNDLKISDRINAETNNIRDEMARIFANQIKALEKRFVEDSKKLQQQNMVLTNELNIKCKDLEITTEQLELLKFTIVNEREEFQSILTQNEESFKDKIEKYQDHIAKLNDQIELIDGERALIENLKKQIDDERKLLSKKEEMALHKLKKLQQESTEVVEKLGEKYKTAKKTAMNYKKVRENMSIY